MSDDDDTMGKTARHAVELANGLADRDREADIRDIADGLLAGAIHYWLYANQPCKDPMCEQCAPIGTAEQRLLELGKLIEEFARDSEYFHTPNDINVGRA